MHPHVYTIKEVQYDSVIDAGKVRTRDTLSLTLLSDGARKRQSLVEWFFLMSQSHFCVF